MKILLFGKSGQVGWELQRSLAPLGELVALHSSSTNLCGDFRDLSGIQASIRTVKPGVIVNAAAYTAVDKAEQEPGLARTLNAEAPGLLAQEAKRLNARLIHYSTDYVFNGNGDRPFVETDHPEPLNIYGQTKLEGERNIHAAGCEYVIFRTSWVYATFGNNFIKTMLRLAQQRDSLKVVNDQTGAPTGAELIADITAYTLLMLKHQTLASGIYHLTAKGYASWFEYAKLILTQAETANFSLKMNPGNLQPIPSREFPLPAQRPLNSRLNTGKLEQALGLQLPDWQTGVQRTLTEILNKSDLLPG
ncbi:MAG: dTDP-4-dehydrorhamnose reductase [Nitrosomonas sp.]|uniref:dTDP-4-dehydrorhamnose reductase n=1 Tax=Nitrosomonas sp. TaxID=42353 RepID=UPI001D94ECD5|nr:dTDP-4-dehydrorhamnose reductase [Nitrosomonas sp.]MBX9894960.1 dTDP-4-dehydrorhamnose reductase [Nitrosomonas sp.]